MDQEWFLHFADEVVAVFAGLGRVEPQVAEPGMEVDERYNEFALDLVPCDQEESIWVPFIIPEEREDIAVRQDSGSLEWKWDKAPKRIGEDLDEISCTENEGAVAEGVVVTEGASPKAKRKRNKKKRKFTNIVKKDKEGGNKSEIEEEKKLLEVRKKDNDLILKDKMDHVMKLREEINRVKTGMKREVEDSEVLEW